MGYYVDSIEQVKLKKKHAIANKSPNRKTVPSSSEELKHLPTPGPKSSHKYFASPLSPSMSPLSMEKPPKKRVSFGKNRAKGIYFGSLFFIFNRYLDYVTSVSALKNSTPSKIMTETTPSKPAIKRKQTPKK